ncbi:TetR/AcrR family transcriptional regulator [Streptomyces sp. NPDC050803]|uniref:TetR/AcrR family transcriptional regulator n=1 Tax=unclassified Streptomyces TaxID=2593676 RepID=UPI003412C6A5
MFTARVTRNPRLLPAGRRPDEVLAASPERQIPAYEARLAPGPQDAAPPREWILELFGRLEANATESEYCGCPYLAALVELKDPEHPASVVARDVKERLQVLFRTQAELGGARDPELLARQLMLVLDGASARAGARIEKLDGLTTTVAALLDAAGME